MKKPPMKDTKKIAAEEIAAMKRGGASKKLLAHEKAEHKAMGMKSGGKVGSMGKRGC
jgi:hypothetical protein